MTGNEATTSIGIDSEGRGAHATVIVRITDATEDLDVGIPFSLAEARTLASELARVADLLEREAGPNE